MIRRLAVMLAGLMLALAPGSAQAACSPLSGCTCVVSATGVSFGSYDPLSASSTDAMGTVRVNCLLLLDLAGSFTIDISPGDSGTFTQRQMRNGPDALAYNLYTSAARSVVWGDGSGVSQRVTKTFAALLLVEDITTVYGRIPAGQNVRAGAYNDTLIVTVTY